MLLEISTKVFSKSPGLKCDQYRQRYIQYSNKIHTKTAPLGREKVLTLLKPIQIYIKKSEY